MLSPLPVEEKDVSWSWCAFAMGFSSCPSTKRQSHGLGVLLRWAFPLCLSRKRLSLKSQVEGLICFSPSGTGKRLNGASRDGLFPLPVWEKATRKALGVFSLTRTRKTQLSSRVCALAMAFPPACRGKGTYVTWRELPHQGTERPPEVPESSQGAPEPKTSQACSRLTL